MFLPFFIPFCGHFQSDSILVRFRKWKENAVGLCTSFKIFNSHIWFSSPISGWKASEKSCLQKRIRRRWKRRKEREREKKTYWMRNGIHAAIHEHDLWIRLPFINISDSILIREYHKLDVFWPDEYIYTRKDSLWNLMQF